MSNVKRNIDRIGKYYKSFRDNSIVKVVGIRFDAYEVTVIDFADWNNSDITDIDIDNFNENNSRLYEYTELKAYNTPLYKALNG